MLKNLVNFFGVFVFSVFLFSGHSIAEETNFLQKKTPVEKIEEYAKQPWDGECTIRSITFQYKRYPKMVDMLGFSLGEMPVTYDCSPLHFALSRTTLAVSEDLIQKNLYESFYFYCDDAEAFKKYLLRGHPELKTEKEFFQYCKKEMLQYWCVGEVCSEPYHAMVCIVANHTPSPNTAEEYSIVCFYKKQNRFYLSLDLEKHKDFAYFMRVVYSSLEDSDGLFHKVFCPPNSKYPSIPRWRCWCNKDRTKATLAELVKIDDRTITLKKYEDKKRVQVKIEDLYIEDQFLLGRLREESEENKATNKSKTKKVNSSKRSKKSKKKTKEAEAESHED